MYFTESANGCVNPLTVQPNKSLGDGIFCSIKRCRWRRSSRDSAKGSLPNPDTEVKWPPFARYIAAALLTSGTRELLITATLLFWLASWLGIPRCWPYGAQTHKCRHIAVCVCVCACVCVCVCVLGGGENRETSIIKLTLKRLYTTCTWNSMIVPSPYVLLDTNLTKFGSHKWYTIFSCGAVHIDDGIVLHIDKSSFYRIIYPAINLDPVTFCQMILKVKFEYWFHQVQLFWSVSINSPVWIEFVSTAHGEHLYGKKREIVEQTKSMQTLVHNPHGLDPRAHWSIVLACKD